MDEVKNYENMEEFEITRKIPTNNSKSVEFECKSIYWFNDNLYYPSIGPKYKKRSSLFQENWNVTINFHPLQMNPSSPYITFF